MRGEGGACVVKGACIANRGMHGRGRAVQGRGCACARDCH